MQMRSCQHKVLVVTDRSSTSTWQRMTRSHGMPGRPSFAGAHLRRQVTVRSASAGCKSSGSNGLRQRVRKGAITAVHHMICYYCNPAHVLYTTGEAGLRRRNGCRGRRYRRGGPPPMIIAARSDHCSAPHDLLLLQPDSCLVADRRSTP